MTDALMLSGKRGHGKSLIAVYKISEYLAQGRCVATNLNIYPEKLCAPWCKVPVFRVPDFPTAGDLELLGQGNPNPTDEGKNGLLVLDECGAWLNARNWNDKSGERQKLISWLLQSRKYGWDLVLIAQSFSLIDSQLRSALCDLHGPVTRLDKIQIPLFGRIASWFGYKLRFPKLHVANIRFGFFQGAPLSERIIIRGANYYDGYDTLQKINPEIGVAAGQGFSYLSAWHLRGRFMSKWEMYRHLILTSFMVALVLGLVAGYQAGIRKSPAQAATVAHAETVYDSGVTAQGYLQDEQGYLVTLSDGRTVRPLQFRQTVEGWEINLQGNEWIKGVTK